MYKYLKGIVGIMLCALCQAAPLNSPYAASELTENAYFSAFSVRPRYLDPAKVYWADEALIISQVYEPPLQYSYLERPYKLTPLAAIKMPTVTYLSRDGQALPEDTSSDAIAYSVYEIEIRPNMFYQPHPAFAKNEKGDYLYHQAENLKSINDLWDLQVDTRVVTAEDYVYEIKRLASPRVSSPIYGLMKNYIVGLEALNQKLVSQTGEIDLKNFELEGVKAIDATHYTIKIKGKYPQFKYWLAMNFFAPMPWEAEKFYSHADLIRKNITLDSFPIGSGPFYLTENNPNRRIVLLKNPHFHGEFYPSQGTPEDKALGLLKDAHQPIPFIEKIVLTLEKETIPRWNKFLQGYYDFSGVISDNFNQAIQMVGTQAELTPRLKEMGVTLLSETQLADFYWGFNMQDPTVGGNSERARKLRRAISIAIDTEEYISIFLNEQGIPAQNMIPPGIFGYRDPEQFYNPYIYTKENGKVQRRNIQDAQKLMLEAGYPNGIDPKTKKPLVLYYDVSTLGDPAEKSRLAWMRKQFEKIGINLEIRATDSNRMRQKLERGTAQIFNLAWIADYPDAENFFMILYGVNSKVDSRGPNSTNYQNEKFDKLFNKLRKLEDNEEKYRLIGKMNEILEWDAPMVWGYYPKAFTLKHQWYTNLKINPIAANVMKYYKIDAQKRNELQNKWNKPIFKPAILFFLFLMVLCIPVIWEYFKKEYRPSQRRIKND